MCILAAQITKYWQDQHRKESTTATCMQRQGLPGMAAPLGVDGKLMAMRAGIIGTP